MRVGRAINPVKHYAIASRAFPQMHLATNWWWTARTEFIQQFDSREEAERWIASTSVRVDHRLVVVEI